MAAYIQRLPAAKQQQHTQQQGPYAYFIQHKASRLQPKMRTKKAKNCSNGCAAAEANIMARKWRKVARLQPHATFVYSVFNLFFPICWPQRLFLLHCCCTDCIYSILHVASVAKLNTLCNKSTQHKCIARLVQHLLPALARSTATSFVCKLISSACCEIYKHTQRDQPVAYLFSFSLSFVRQMLQVTGACFLLPTPRKNAVSCSSGEDSNYLLNMQTHTHIYIIFVSSLLLL